jgi:hypothetical protein
MQFERFFRAGSYFADLVRQTIEDKTEGSFNLTDIPLRSEILTREEMALHAVRLAQSHRVKLTGREGVNLYARFAQNREVIEKSYFAFAEAANANEPLTPGAEWLLDNYHVIEEQVRDIKRHLPRSYYKTLPKLTSEDFTGYPRVYHLAFEIIAHSDALGRLGFSFSLYLGLSKPFYSDHRRALGGTHHAAAGPD